VENIDYRKLEKHDTKDIHDQHVNGALTVIWRDWDKLIQPEPKMVYISAVNSGEIKGPHVHLKRNSYFVCIHGKVVFIIKKENGEYDEIISSEENPILVHIPKNIASAHINLNKKSSKILTLADISWKPNDNEMENISFSDYDWTKWKNYVE
jgi:dTDP-4-dehydrorhamnose 3,5-epimerase|tara:strand:+ start:56 stop:511 length:456 start_codon:yes stop_codon:yes gene_type:complete